MATMDNITTTTTTTCPSPDDSQLRHLDSPPTLQIDFSYSRFRLLLAEQNQPSNPIYTVDFRLTKPHGVIKSTSDNTTVGSGSLRLFSINADYEIHGQKRTLEAVKRFDTAYIFLSHAFSGDDSPTAMTWTGDCGLKTWDFICLDERQLPVAKITANWWAVKRVGYIEFLGSKAASPAARDEIVVTGLTVMYCMVSRMNNLFSIFGALVARPDANRAKIESKINESK